MKKLFAIFLALALILLCGCKAEPKEETPESTGQVIGFGGTADSIFDDEGEETTDPVESQDTTEAPTEDPTEEPVESETSGETEPEPSVPAQTDPPSGGNGDSPMTYEKFNDLSPKEKREYQESFDSLEAFFEWYEAEKAKYEEENPPIIIDGNGQIVLP